MNREVNKAQGEDTSEILQNNSVLSKQKPKAEAYLATQLLQAS